MNTRGYGLTDVGRKRKSNEDAFLILDDCALYAVADGMGGHMAGELASELAIHILKTIPRAVLAAKLVGTHEVIHKAILNESARPDRRGMATTLTVVAIIDAIAHVAHVGDSALYLVRGGRSQRLTEDQTVGGVLEKKHGVKAREQDYSKLLNCVGNRFSSFSGAQSLEFPILPNDVLVLCSDGLTGYIKTDQQIADLGRGLQSIEQYAKALMSHALESGGSDNVTVVLIHVI